MPASPPLIVDSLPEIAMVGLTSEMCERLGIPYVESSANLDACEPRVAPTCSGKLKLVVQRDTRALIGVQVIGFGAAEFVQLGALLVAKERSVRELLSLAPPEGSRYALYASAARDAIRAALAATEPGSRSRRGTRATQRDRG